MDRHKKKMEAKELKVTIDFGATTVTQNELIKNWLESNVTPSLGRGPHGKLPIKVDESEMRRDRQ